MEDILLTSVEFVKETTNISDNVDSKYIVPAIREAQQMGLRHIIGTKLYNKLVRLVGAGTISGASARHYKELLDESQYYLAYKTISELVVKLAYKVTNMGVVKTSDDNVINASIQELVYNKEYYQSKADSHMAQLQRYLLANRNDYPELSENTCNDIKAQLYSAASCGIFLGGARGK